MPFLYRLLWVRSTVFAFGGKILVGYKVKPKTQKYLVVLYAEFFHLSFAIATEALCCLQIGFMVKRDVRLYWCGGERERPRVRSIEREGDKHAVRERKKSQLKWTSEPGFYICDEKKCYRTFKMCRPFWTSYLPFSYLNPLIWILMLHEKEKKRI